MAGGYIAASLMHPGFSLVLLLLLLRTLWLASFALGPRGSSEGFWGCSRCALVRLLVFGPFRASSGTPKLPGTSRDQDLGQKQS